MVNKGLTKLKYLLFGVVTTCLLNLLIGCSSRSQNIEASARSGLINCEKQLLTNITSNKKLTLQDCDQTRDRLRTLGVLFVLKTYQNKYWLIAIQSSQFLLTLDSTDSKIFKYDLSSLK
jgi:hypothetical protein